MAIRYGRVNVVNDSELDFAYTGDGVSTVLVVNLAAAPFMLDLSGHAPVGAFVDAGQPGVTATAAVTIDGNSDTILTVTFDTPPEEDNSFDQNLDILFIYASL